jgi:hypothetical protein
MWVAGKMKCNEDSKSYFHIETIGIHKTGRDKLWHFIPEKRPGKQFLD